LSSKLFFWFASILDSSFYLSSYFSITRAPPRHWRARRVCDKPFLCTLRGFPEFGFDGIADSNIL